MSSKPTSRPWRTVVGFVIGAVVGFEAAAGPFVGAIAGGIIGFVSAGASGKEAHPATEIARFLRDAYLAGDVDDETYARLRDRVMATGSTARTPASVAPPAPVLRPPESAEPTTAPSQPVPEPAARATAPATQPPPPVPPSGPKQRRRSPLALSTHLRPLVEAWGSLRADFAVQGLGSLGVLLVFTATLGFVIFAFTEVGVAFRPVAEVMVPVVLFAMSGVLRRRSAPFMATALEGLGGAVTPIMVFAAFSDGSPLPPDVAGASRLVVLSGAAFLLAAGYARLAVRRDSPLRYLVAPLVWVGVGVVGTAVDRGVSAATFAVVLGGIGVTPWLLRDRCGVVAAAGRAAVLPGLGVGYALLVLFSYAEGWPAVPVLVGGLAAVAAVEGVAVRARRVWVAEAMIVAITGLAVVPDLGAGWSGFGTVIAALALVERWRGSADAAVVVRVAGSLVGIGALAAVTDPAATLATGVVVASWAHTRRLVPVTAFGVAPALAGAIAPAVAAYGLSGVTQPSIALATVGAVLVSLSPTLRARSGGDGYLASGILVYAIGVGVVGILPGLVGRDLMGAAALAAAAVAVAVVPRGAAVRVWTAVALGAGAWYIAVATFSLAAPVLAGGLAVAGLALVAAGVLVAGRAGGHLAGAGHLLGTLALPLVIFDPMRITVLAAWLAAWLLELAGEPERAPLVRLAGGLLPGDATQLLPLPVLVSSPVLALAVLAEIRPTAGLAGVALVLAATAVAYGILAGGPVWRPALSTQSGPAAVAASVLSLVPAAGFDPFVAGTRGLQATVLGCGIVGVAATGRRMARWMAWYAWSLASPLAVLAGLAVGLGANDIHWAAFVWGAAAATVALSIDGAWTGRRRPLSIDRRWLRPPVVVGAVTAVAALGAGSFEPLGAIWPLALAATVWTAAMAYLLRAEPLVVLPLVSATVAYVSALDAAGFDAVADPVLLTWPSLVLLGVAVVAPRTGTLGRPDVPALGVGLVVSGVALAAGLAAGATDGTWAPIGAMLIVVGVAKREWLALAAAGSVLTIAAAAFAGAWWLASVLALHALASGVLARLGDASQAAPAQWASAGFGAAAWAVGLWAIAATPSVALAATSAASSAVAVVAGVAVRRRDDPDYHATWSGPWVAVALAGIVVSAVVGLDAGAMPGARWALAAAVAVWSAAAVFAGTRLNRDELRLLASTALLASVAASGWAAGLAASGWAMLTLAAAVALTTAAVVGAATVARTGWTWWLIGDAALLHLGGVGLAALLLPDRTMLVLALLAAAGASVAVDVLVEIRGARYFAPGLVFGAWMAFITEAAATNNIQWYVPPFALAVLVDLEMVRRRRRVRGLEPISTEDMTVAELVAIAVLVGPSFVQIVLESVGYGLAAIGWGTLIAAWGAVTRVRRRLAAGGIAAAVGAVLMVAVPVARLLPQFRGPALWAVVFVVGAVLITVAATLEQTRRRLGEVKTSFGRITAGWE